MPPGVRPYVKGAVFRNRRTGKEVWGNFYGHTWRNSANAQHHRQAVYFNILPKINGPQMYLRYVAPDDWNHGTIVKAINRVKAKTEDDDHGWVGFDNALERGHYVYLTSVPGVPGFEPVEGDIEPILVDALKALHPPDRGEEGRYHGYWGSANWTKRAEIADEDDQDVCDLLAVSDHPLDKVQVEAECRASGVRCEEIRRYWRRQVGEGLETSLGDERAVRLAVYMGYRPTKHGRAVLAASGGDNSGREEPVGAVDATLESPDSGGWGERWVVMI
jgi:hypothetical protein